MEETILLVKILFKSNVKINWTFPLQKQPVYRIKFKATYQNTYLAYEDFYEVNLISHTFNVHLLLKWPGDLTANLLVIEKITYHSGNSSMGSLGARP